jgi:hypothetical protein
MVIPLWIDGSWLLFATGNLGALQQNEKCIFCMAHFHHPKTNA